MPNGNEPPDSTLPGAIARCIETLEALVADRALLAALDGSSRQRLLQAAGRLSRPERTEQRALSKALRRRDHAETRAADELVLDATWIRAARRVPVFVTPPPHAHTRAGAAVLPAAPAGAARPAEASAEPAPNGAAGPELREPRKCYVCKAEFRRVHFFYDQLCPPCAELGWRKRNQSARLDGRVALVTGARVKIGYQAAIMLLRAGARVVVTTRFPHDAALRYAREADHGAWKDRLSIYGLDLRHTPSVEAFAAHLTGRLDRLDFVLHNACQTVRRPAGFYAHLVEQELRPAAELPPAVRPLLAGYDALRAAPAPPRLAAGLTSPALLSQAAVAQDDRLLSGRLDPFPSGKLDADLQQVDLRERNSWRLTLAEVPTAELLEVHLVNAVAPFVLSARLKPLLVRDGARDKHIVNVSAMEGQFYREHKTDRHPHTNMAKAALNMLTRTSAADYVNDGIHMNSVDTGWVTDEDPVHLAARKEEEHGFHPPLDIVDGAARICDPIFTGLSTGVHPWGQFFKDYRPTPW